MQSKISESADKIWRHSYNPLTNTMIAACIVVFLCTFLRLPIGTWLLCEVPQGFIQPWRLLTYPFVIGDPLSLIFTCLLLWWGGGSLERSWGTKTFAIFYAALCFVTAVAFELGVLLFKGNGFVSGYLVFAAALIAWCALNPDETIRIYGIIPVKSRYLAVGECLIIFFVAGWNNPIMGLFALMGCGFAVLWVKQGWAYKFGVVGGMTPPGFNFSVPKRKKGPKLRLVPSASSRPKDDKFTLRDLNPFEMLAKRRRRKQFEKLMDDD